MIVFPEEHTWGVDIALKKLRPGAGFTLSGQEFLDWEDPNGLPPPTWDEIKEQIAKDKATAEEWQKKNLVE